ncbi:hypothetical protein [Methylobacter sp.]|nr:hypothetical protein [Methylobacter sp.]
METGLWFGSLASPDEKGRTIGQKQSLEIRLIRINLIDKIIV